MSKDYKNISLAEIASGSLKYGESVAVEGEVVCGDIKVFFAKFYYLTNQDNCWVCLDGMPFPRGVVPSLKQAERTKAPVTVYGRYVEYDGGFRGIRVHKVIIYGEGNLSIEDGTLEGCLSLSDEDGRLSLTEDKK